MRRSNLRPLALSAIVFAVAACKRTDAAAPAPAESASGAATAAATSSSASKAPAAIDGPILGVISGQANVMSEPRAESRRIGYLHLGAIVKRDDAVAGKAGCPGGWYKIQPRGYVCTGDEATIDPSNPILRASAITLPDRHAAMPYRYGFVRAVLPLYLRAPNRDDQLKSEFKLKDNLDKFDGHEGELNNVILGSYDVPLDERSVPLVGKKAGDVAHPSTSWGQGQLFGGQGEDDPIPWWLDGGRKIPNVADFKVPEYAAFADRARRHTGLAFVGSFKMGDDAFHRRFAITTDMRLAPTSKVKPDTGSPWHGMELGEGANAPPLPFAWVRTSDVKTYKVDGESAKAKGTLEKRSVVLVTGKKISGPDGFYWELKNGQYIKATEAGVVKQPDEWPDAAKKGQKWIEVSIENQTLTLWQGQKPVYATMVSTGQDGMKDPKTTKSTIRGVFNIRSKHVTATMDSNEGSSMGGGKRPSVASAAHSEERERSSDDAPAKKSGGKKHSSKVDSGDSDSPKKAKSAPSKDSSEDAPKHEGRDAAYGVTKRRGEGNFWLRDVPYVEYFESGYALHVAYWHDVFGIARSHGCINLSPLDGKYIFGWTDPQVPEGWQGIMSGGDFGEGTVVIVHE